MDGPQLGSEQCLLHSLAAVVSCSLCISACSHARPMFFVHRKAQRFWGWVVGSVHLHMASCQVLCLLTQATHFGLLRALYPTWFAFAGGFQVGEVLCCSHHHV